MKMVLAVVWILTLAAAFGLGRSTVPRETVARPGMVVSLSDALEDEDLLTRTHRLADSLQGLSPENLDEALAVFEEKRWGVTESEVRLLILAWSRFDPAAVFAWARAGPMGGRSTLEGEAIYAWAYRDPQGAVGALDQLEESRQRALRGNLVKGWARSDDKRGVTEYVFSLPPTRRRAAFINLVVGWVRKDGVDAVIDWAEAVPDDGPNAAKEAAFQVASGVVAESDASKAAAWFEAHREFEYARRAIKVIALRWVDHHDPPALFEWLEGLPADETRDDGVRAGFVRWWKVNPEEAGAWLRGATLTAALDPALAVFARNTSRSSSESAIEWAERIQDEKLRRQTVTPILRMWSREDPRAVQAWMAEHDVPEAVRQKIVNSPRFRMMETHNSATETTAPSP